MRGEVTMSMNQGNASDQDETVVGETGKDAPVVCGNLMERVVERGNLIAALRKVERNGGSPGIDGMAVEELRDYLREHWPEIKGELLRGEYKPMPVKRVEIPKPGGGIRCLGIPTVLDRFIQQATLQILQVQWDGGFSDHSFGFRPGRSAHQAIERALSYLRKGYRWVVDIDLEKFFDRVNHDKLMSLVKERVSDIRVLRLINRYLNSGAIIGNVYHPTGEGTPQGGPLSPLLANLLLDRLDKELERRGHRFARYADDCNIYVRSKRAGQRVMAGVTRYLSQKLRLKVNALKSAVARPWQRTFLGFTLTYSCKSVVSGKAVKRFKEEVRRHTFRTRGVSVKNVVSTMRRYLLGWKAYFGFCESRSILKELDSWVRRRLRCYLWKQWGKGGYHELRRRGVSRDLAWNTAKSAHGPWRLSRSPALAFALPARYFASIGLPSLQEMTMGQLNQPNRRGT
ncbi:MAG: group II intron reverse transcriptase/maturase [Nitrospirae bacterium]|nr:group II intron reverse transcriptase/maturase [Nitrospirota bacterium]MCL5423193.1 group II intron reverse transcriptase/maturase [Nitrospirota bacterium]